MSMLFSNQAWELFLTKKQTVINVIFKLIFKFFRLDISSPSSRIFLSSWNWEYWNNSYFIYVSIGRKAGHFFPHFIVNVQVQRGHLPPIDLPRGYFRLHSSSVIQFTGKSECSWLNIIHCVLKCSAFSLRHSCVQP